MPSFIWDPAKAAKNRRKHHVSFEEATTAFFDRDALYEPDKGHPERGNLIGVSSSLRILFVVHVELLDSAEIRIISARKATRPEKRRYEGK